MMEHPPWESDGVSGAVVGTTYDGSQGGDLKPKAKNTLTAAQREKMKRKENVEVAYAKKLPKAEVLTPRFAADLRESQKIDGAKTRERKRAEQAWLAKLRSGDYSGPVLDRLSLIHI